MLKRLFRRMSEDTIKLRCDWCGYEYTGNDNENTELEVYYGCLYATTAMDAAKVIVDKCQKQGISISNLKLQTLLYFIWIEYYKQNKAYLFEDEFEAWQFGAVVKSVYYEFCGYGGMSIFLPQTIKREIPKEVNEIIDVVLDKFGRKSVYELIQEINNKNGAWANVYNNGIGYRQRIPFEEIIDRETEFEWNCPLCGIKNKITNNIEANVAKERNK